MYCGLYEFGRSLRHLVLGRGYICLLAGAPQRACGGKGAQYVIRKIFMKSIKNIDDMGAPCITPWIQDSIIHHTAVECRVTGSGDTMGGEMKE